MKGWIGQVAELFLKYDREKGSYPESEYEGQAVLEYLLGEVLGPHFDTYRLMEEYYPDRKPRKEK